LALLVRPTRSLRDEEALETIAEDYDQLHSRSAHARARGEDLSQDSGDDAEEDSTDGEEDEPGNGPANGEDAATTTPPSHWEELRNKFACKVADDKGEVLPEWKQLVWDAGRDYTGDEEEAGFAKLGLANISDTRFRHASCKEQPNAVFFLGPPGVGKRTAAREFKAKLGLATDGGKHYDAVLLDSDLLRLEHKGYQALLAEGKKQKCVVQEAFGLLRPQLAKLKQKLLQRATDVKCRHNLLIPHTCNNFTICIQNINILKSRNYTVSALDDSGPEKELMVRAFEHATKNSEPIPARSFARTGFVAFLPVFTVANGHCVVVTGNPPDVLMNFTCPNEHDFKPMNGVIPPEFPLTMAKVVNASGVTLDMLVQATVEAGIVAEEFAPTFTNLVQLAGEAFGGFRSSGDFSSQESISSNTSDGILRRLVKARGLYSKELADEYSNRTGSKFAVRSGHTAENVTAGSSGSGSADGSSSEAGESGPRSRAAGSRGGIFAPFVLMLLLACLAL